MTSRNIVHLLTRIWKFSFLSDSIETDYFSDISRIFDESVPKSGMGASRALQSQIME